MTHRRSLRPAKSSSDLASFASPEHIAGAEAASEAFRRAGIRHVLVGGLAVGARGYPRQTKDVDFLVGDEAFDFHGPLVTPKPGLPVRYGSITIDWVSLEPHELSAFDRYLVVPPQGTVPIIASAPLIAMKLIAGRQKDLADVVELLKAGASYEDALAFVQINFPEEIPTLIDLAEKARTED